MHFILRTFKPQPTCMLQRFFSPRGIATDSGLGLMRILVGSFMIYHGFEVFDKAKIDEYAKWMTDLHYNSPHFMAYLGKGTEFVGGIFFLLGLFTRLSIIALAATMLFITFCIGHGKIYMDDQHPFLFVVIFIIYFFTGPGRWSVDGLIFGRNRAQSR